MEYSELERLITDTIPWVKDSGLRVDLMAKNHIRLTVPPEKHLNHVGIVYAGTHFMLMEVAGAALYFATYGLNNLVPVNKHMEISYLKPAFGDISCELSLDEETARAMMAPVEQRGRGDWILDMAVTDTSGVTVSKARCNYYLIPTPA